MRLLLDSHVLVWWDNGTPLSRGCVEAVCDADEVYVSMASTWELTIKASAGRLRIPRPLPAILADNGFLPLPILLEHTQQLATLPHHHRDPFDRLLVAQALAEGLTLVTRDPQLARYAVPLIAA
jgi:PIN domain nuclease of toxin-antitoxin system